MKRIILIISTVFLYVYSINAQNQISNFQTIIDRIDSLKTTLTVGGTTRVRDHQWNFNDLSVEERNQVLDHMETVLFSQIEYMSFYSLGISLLVNFFDSLVNCDDKHTRDRIARLYLDNMFYVFDESFTFLGRVADYSEETRERLRNILERNKTEEDIQARRKLATWDIKRGFHRDIDNNVNRIMRETDRDCEETRAFLTDSVTAVFIENRIQFMDNFPPFYRRAVLRIGSSNDSRFVPGLEQLLGTQLPVDDTAPQEFRANTLRGAIIYALAKLGVQKYLDIVFAREHFNFRYLGTQEAFLIHLERNFVWNRRCRSLTDGGVSLCAIITIVDAVGTVVVRQLTNIPDEIGDLASRAIIHFSLPEDIENYDPNQDERNRKHIQNIYYIYNWIMENQDVWVVRQIDYF